MSGLQCLNCGRDLSGRQKKYCSRTCKNRFSNNLRQSYQAQQRRGEMRAALLKLPCRGAPS